MPNLAKAKPATNVLKKFDFKYCIHLSKSLFLYYKNKTNHPISSDSYPSATANKAINYLYKTNDNIIIILIKYEAVHLSVILEFTVVGLLSI